MNRKKISISIIGAIIVVVVAIIIVGKIYNKADEYSYVNKHGDKYTEQQLATIKMNNLRINNMEQEIREDSNKMLGSLTIQAQKDLNADIPDIKDDSAKDILGLQNQLLSNLQQDLAAN